MEDTPEREALIHKMVAIVVEECPWIFNFHSPSYVLRHSWDKNGKSHSISGNYAKYIRVEPAVRQAYWKVQDRPNLRVPLYALGLSRRGPAAGDRDHFHKEEKVVVYYIIRRILLAVPTVVGVCLVTFLLFNVFASPEAVARRQLGKNPTEVQVKAWISAHGMDKPMFFNLKAAQDGRLHPFDSRFWNQMRELLLFQFPESDYLHENVGDLIKEKIGPSLTITVPAFLLSIIVTLPLALFSSPITGAPTSTGWRFSSASSS